MHLAYDEKDIHGIDFIIGEWRKKGFVGEIDKSTANRGYISITTANWKKNDGSFVIMELHKLKGQKGLFGVKTNWIVRLLSSPNGTIASATVHGCVEGMTQLIALDKAHVDIGYDFMSRTRIEDYFVK